MPCVERKESQAIDALCHTIKDHKNAFTQDLVNDSFTWLYKQEVRNFVPGMEEESDSQISSQNERFPSVSEKVVRVVLVNKSFQQSLEYAMSKMETKLVTDRVGFDQAPTVPASQGTSEEIRPHHLSNTTTVVINDIGIAMKEPGYALHRGQIFKKVDRARYTYTLKCSPREFVNTLASNESFKSRLLNDMKRVIDIISEPCCEVIKPIQVNYDLIEVDEGQCWSVKRHTFIEDAISESDVGRITPRAYCKYDPSTPPIPRYFREILENSLSGPEIPSFCHYFLKLLEHHGKKHKDRVPCLVGDSNSGKTSLFLPILGVIHYSRMATITKQGAFNKAMITPETQVIFLDEATTSLLKIDDWKTITQGGFAAYDVKYKTAQPFINKCPMIITAQEELDFSEKDKRAMEKRLQVYKFMSLPRPKKKGAEWLKRHPMDCIVWAATNAKAPLENEADESESESESDNDSESEDGILKEEEKEALRHLVLEDSEVNDSRELVSCYVLILAIGTTASQSRLCDICLSVL